MLQTTAQTSAQAQALSLSPSSVSLWSALYWMLLRLISSCISYGTDNFKAQMAFFGGGEQCLLYLMRKGPMLTIAPASAAKGSCFTSLTSPVLWLRGLLRGTRTVVADALAGSEPPKKNPEVSTSSAKSKLGKTHTQRSRTPPRFY